MRSGARSPSGPLKSPLNWIQVVFSILEPVEVEIRDPHIHRESAHVCTKSLFRDAQGGVHPSWNHLSGLRLGKKPVPFAVRLAEAVFSRALPREKPVRHRSSVVEHTLGKGEVTGSNPVGGFHRILRIGSCPDDRVPRWYSIIQERPLAFAWGHRKHLLERFRRWPRKHSIVQSPT